MSENNDASSESNSRSSSDGLLQASRFGGAPIIRTGVLRPSVLGPSVLSTSGTNNSSHNSASISETTNNKEEDKKSVIELVNNPFLKDPTEDNNENDDDGPGTSRKLENKSKVDLDQKDDEKDERPDPMLLLRRNGMERASMFAAAKSSIPLVEKSGFVFGQNVHERVIGENLNPEKSTRMGNDVESGSAGDLLFSSVIQKAATKTEDSEKASSSSGGSKETECKSLTDVAREYEESRAQKRKYEEVETFTGEENEMNICDVNCKLFAFVNSNWEERGRGSLRMNDSKIETNSSRVVFRTAGNLRLLVNTKVWAGMVAERPSPKSLRFTAMDQTGKIKIFLAMARPAEIDSLHLALKNRIEKRIVLHPEERRRVVTESNGEESKNGTDESEDAKAASVAEPDNHDDHAEPSPKKAITEEPSKN